jgi:hypothetical protein
MAMSIASFALIAEPDTREQSPETPATERGTKSPGDHRRQVGRLLRRLFGIGYRDPLFEQPDLVEDDYCRFINQPRGW